jgi:hypothetical protein
MAARKPLVIVAGQIEQLQSGDTLSATVAEIETLTQTNGEADALVIGSAVYNDLADSVKRGQSNAAATSEIIGFATAVTIATGQPATVQTSGVLEATTDQWDAMSDLTGGLNVGEVYYLDDAVAGEITATAPTTAGKYVVRVGRAISTTGLLIEIRSPILL